MRHTDSAPAAGTGSPATWARVEPSAARRVSQIARACAVLGFALGFVGLLGWGTGHLELIGGFAHAITMKANTALCLSLTGAALFLRISFPSRASALRGADSFAAIVIGLAVLTLTEHIFGCNLGIDELLFRDTNLAATTYPGRMGPPASLSFTTLGLGLLILDRSTRWRALPQWLALFVASIAALSIFGYIAKASQLYGIAHYTGIALPSALGILSLSVGLCLARPERGPSVIFIADNAGGELARRVLPAAILLPALIGWLRTLGEELGYYDRAFGRALLLLSLTTVFTTIVWAIALRSSSVAEARSEAQHLLSENLRTLGVLDSLLTHAPLGLAFFDRDGRCVRANAYLADLHGGSALGLQGLLTSEVLPGWEQGLDNALQRVFAEGTSRMNIEMVGSPYDEERSWLCGFFPVYDPDGQVRSSGCVILENTEHRRLESQRSELLESERAARSEAERAAALKDQFLASLSHELRTPLTAILGWVAVARNTPALPDELRRPLEIIERNSRLQAKLIEDLLDVSSIVSGKLQLDRQVLDAGQLLQNAVQAITPSASAKAIRLRLELPKAPLCVSGDPVRLAQVTDNLLANAIKFTPENGQVSVLASALEKTLEIRVIDSGQGISSEFLPHVFDRFRQADATTSRRHGGLGLGLSIVRQLVELHGGTVRAESEGIGRGATFTVCLPLSDEAPALSARGARGTLSPDLRDLRVLVVDDEADTRELLARVLERSRASVETVANAAAALASLRSRKPDLLLSDIGMPDMDGYTFIREVRAIYDLRALPAIAITAFVRSEDRERALVSGFQLHMVKPIDPHALVRAIAKLTGRSDESPASASAGS
jgi:signal transduction histidine kinase/ActR/RegA family two-component response regulator